MCVDTQTSIPPFVGSESGPGSARMGVEPGGQVVRESSSLIFMWASEVE